MRRRYFDLCVKITSVARVEIVLLLRCVAGNAGHRSTLAFLRVCVIAATGIRKHTQVELLWITRRIRRISAFSIGTLERQRIHVHVTGDKTQ